MWILLVEILVVLVLAAFIIWWTLFDKPKNTPSEPSEEKPDQSEK
jgi:flagellar basal body-associated protein FliL